MQNAPATFGRYKLLGLLGEGGMAKVYRAVLSGPMGFEKEVALKKIDSRLTQDDRFVKALINEARLGGQLRHKNIVEVYEFDQVDGDYFLAMEFVDGWTLDTVLRECRKASRWVPVPVAIDIAVQICRGLDFAHSLRDKDGQEMHLVHRDLKPANVIISRSGDVKIMDFGIAKADSNLYKTTAADVTKGTPIYMSPEQVRGESLNARSDLFSLGSIIHELVTLKVVFGGDQLLTIMHKVLQADVSEAIERVEERLAGLGPVLAKSMARKVEERYASAQELRRDLERLRTVALQQEPGASMHEWFAEFETWGAARPAKGMGSGSHGELAASQSMATGTQSLANTRSVEPASGELGSFTRAFLEGGTGQDARPAGPVPIGPGAGAPHGGRASTSSPGLGGSRPLTSRERGFYETEVDATGRTAADLPVRVGTRQKTLLAAGLGVVIALVLAIAWAALRGDPEGAVTPPSDPGATATAPPTPAPVTPPPVEAPPDAATSGMAAADPAAAPDPVVEPVKTDPEPAKSRAETEKKTARNDPATPRRTEKKPDPAPARTDPAIEVAKADPAKSKPAVVAVAAPPPAATGKGKIRVNSKPWSHVYLDGVPIGSTPRRDYEVSAGTHTLLLRCGSCATDQRRELSFTVEAGTTKDIGLIQFQD